MKKRSKELKDLSDRMFALEIKVDELSLTLKSIDESLKALVSSSSISKELNNKIDKSISDKFKVLNTNLKTIANTQQQIIYYSSLR